ncbi:MAG: hypothetical protein K6C30_08015, partial [Bacteroidaceae bacterium]|nr:hypothetical protein [Bacteroidaceae bacterium]
MKRNIFLLLLAGALMLMAEGCTKQSAVAPEADSLAVVDSAELVLRIRNTSKLYTAEYQVHKIITHSDVKRLRTTVMGHEYDTS